MPAVITIRNLTKSYGDVTALRDLSLAVPAGTVYGVLGPNGAGKTTLLRLIVGLIFPDRGEITLDGCRPHELGYLPERPHFPGRFRLGEYLEIAGRASGLEGPALKGAVGRVLVQTGLARVVSYKLSTCSKGMLQRLGVAQTLLTDPPLIMMDEPFSGLDPAAQAAMRHLIWELSAAGRTLLLSTHRLSDVNQMCSHIAILSHGRLARSGPLEEVLVPRSQLLIRVDRLPALIAWQLTQLHPAVSVQDDEVILPEEAVRFKGQCLRILLDARIDVLHLEQQRATLEEVYLQTVHQGSGS